MRIFFPCENVSGENRASILPEFVEKYQSAGLEVQIESGIGSHINISDKEFEEKGAIVVGDREKATNNADLVVRLNKPAKEEVFQQKTGSLHISFLDPFREKTLVEAFSAHGISSVSMEMIPRSTIAQKMDALSSQANLAGYFSVILAAERLGKLLPMMMTPAGTLQPARVFVLGAGVAGLQAIATAKRLGARVEAYDTRPVAAEQIQSLGARAIKIDLGETGQTEQGYAKALTEEQIEKQQEALAKVFAHCDVVITTALVFGKPAPLLITEKMMEQMQPGSVIVDMAVETGGNVALSRSGQEIVHNGIRLVGYPQLARRVPYHASQAYAANIYHLITHLWNEDNKSFNTNPEDEILKHCLITHQGDIVSDVIKKNLQSSK